MNSTTMAVDRHRRQKLLPWLDERAQARIAGASVLVTRLGGLGGPFAQALAMAGVGRIVFFHEGVLLEEDLHRMTLMNPDEVGEQRAPQAEASLRKFGRSDFDVLGHAVRVTPDAAAHWMRVCDLAVGAAPTFEERLILNDAAVAAGKPFVDAAMYAGETQILCVRPGETACLRCLVPALPPWRHDFPVLGAVSATVGCLAASLCLKILAGANDVPWGEYIHFDTDRLSLTHTRVARRPDCPVCASLSRGVSV